MENFGGLAESESVSQYFDFIEYLSIQLSVVYLSVYQWRFAVVFILVLQTCFLNGTHQKKVFLHLTVHTVHLWFFINNFILILGEYTVKGEQWIVHLMAIAGKKRPAVAGLEWVMSLRVRRISAASRRSFPLSATGWSVSPALYAAFHNSGRTLSTSWAAPARTFSG